MESRRLIEMERRLDEIEGQEVVSPFAYTSLVLSLPGLTGFWPGAIRRTGNTTWDYRNLAGSSIELNYNSGAKISLIASRVLVPAYNFDGVDDYIYHTNATQIQWTGLETHVGSRGLTVCCWVFFNQTATARGADEGLISRWSGSAGGNSFTLHREDASSEIRFAISADGTNIALNPGASYTGEDEWVFVAGQFATSSGDAYVWLDNVRTTAAGSVASLATATGTDLVMGARDTTPNQPLDGYICYPWIANCFLNDQTMRQLYITSRPLFANRGWS